LVFDPNSAYVPFAKLDATKWIQFLFFFVCFLCFNNWVICSYSVFFGKNLDIVEHALKGRAISYSCFPDAFLNNTHPPFLRC
jgi:hypothetical protein